MVRKICRAAEEIISFLVPVYVESSLFEDVLFFYSKGWLRYFKDPHVTGLIA